MNTRTLLIAVSAKAEINCDNLSLRSLILDIQEIEKRIAAGSNIRDEHKRHALTRDRIEYLLMFNSLLAKGERVGLLTVDLGNEYQLVLDQITTLFPEQAVEARIGRSILLVHQVAQHLKVFSDLAKRAGLHSDPAVKTRVNFLQQANRKGMIVVEIVNPTYFAEVVYSEKGLARILSLFRRKREAVEEVVDSRAIVSSFTQLSIADQPTEDRRKPKIEITREALQKTLSATTLGQATALNIGNFDWGENDSNDVVTEALHEFVFSIAPRGTKSPLYVPVVYMDGSRAESFPFYAFKSVKVQSSSKKIPIFNVGMISARHPELDSIVDTYWLRNQEISGKGAGAETDEISYKQSKKLFIQMRTEGDYNIAFYQTGLFPALVGFYRALAEELIFRRNEKYPVLSVTPMYFRGGTNYEPGSIWS